jgi:diketogulonate reductase-like aldo/keto reductase
MVVQVLLKWNMQRGVPVIPKATSRGHLAENFVDMFAWRLTNQQKVRQANNAVLCVQSQAVAVGYMASVQCLEEARYHVSTLSDKHCPA